MASPANLFGYLVGTAGGNAISAANETGDISSGGGTGSTGVGSSQNAQPTMIMNKIIKT